MRETRSEDYQEMQGGSVSILLNVIAVKSRFLEARYIISSESAMMVSLVYLWCDVTQGRTDPLIKWLRPFKAVAQKKTKKRTE